MTNCQTKVTTLSSAIKPRDLIKLYDVRMVQNLHYFHLAKDFLQISFIQLGLVNNLDGNLNQHNTQQCSE